MKIVLGVTLVKNLLQIKEKSNITLDLDFPYWPDLLEGLNRGASTSEDTRHTKVDKSD